MSHKHANLLRDIFHDPINTNIHWREIESLLKHLGADTESLSGARIRVKLGHAEGILHRPHHGGNTLDRSSVQDALGMAELHPDPRARQRLGVRAEMLQQRLDLAPVNVGVDRIVKDLAQQVGVFVAHTGVTGAAPARRYPR
jgi:hypothetical protein